ncbi:GNAT family N-acetyltransferase [Dactylosporangium matsuzakiense]|uniref:N-acetyltransferase n=1 Tax=Dactylosporangium matsuzakiense TaxID=53360 RepID=A0A9W6NKA6_9ACTN|nr:GNAT family N-acetyltransferase [Dactylosporangium matsuzakiense]UWZ46002.1 GNAT family N-acetyltransferase [Dactylosporangium matsuzakiense]GLL00119.1 N-acetyltransferase [Dactylosporangium matsuzakiense]
MALQVRLITAADYDDVARITVEAYRADGQLQVSPEYATVLADVAGRAAAADILVAEDGGVLVGAVAFTLAGGEYAEVARDGEAEFRTLAVDPAAQRRGVAQALVQACVERAVGLGCQALVIGVRHTNSGAFALYERLGFERDASLDWSPAPGVNLLGLRLRL